MTLASSHSDKRELVYSVLSLGVALISWRWAKIQNALSGHADGDTWSNVAAFVFVAEFGKVFLAFATYPSPQALESPLVGSLNNGKQLPMHKNKEGGMSSRQSLTNTNKFLQGPKIIWYFLSTCIPCFVGAVLFGAPITGETLQFSVIMTSLICAPLCLHFPPNKIPQDLPFIGLWNMELETVWRSKLRTIFTLVGTLCGAVVFPLDWDREWQKWPIPCVASSFISFVLGNVFASVYLSYSLYLAKTNAKPKHF